MLSTYCCIMFKNCFLQNYIICNHLLNALLISVCFGRTSAVYPMISFNVADCKTMKIFTLFFNLRLYLAIVYVLFFSMLLWIIFYL